MQNIMIFSQSEHYIDIFNRLTPAHCSNVVINKDMRRCHDLDPLIIVFVGFL